MCTTGLQEVNAQAIKITLSWLIRSSICTEDKLKYTYSHKSAVYTEDFKRNIPIETWWNVPYIYQRCFEVLYISETFHIYSRFSNYGSHCWTFYLTNSYLSGPLALQSRQKNWAVPWQLQEMMHAWFFATIQVVHRAALQIAIKSRPSIKAPFNLLCSPSCICGMMLDSYGDQL